MVPCLGLSLVISLYPSLPPLTAPCLANMYKPIFNSPYLIKLSQATYDLGQTASYMRPELNSSYFINDSAPLIDRPGSSNYCRTLREWRDWEEAVI